MGRSIVFLTRALDTGGAQRQLVELACGLQRNGWKVDVLTFYGGGSLENSLTSQGVPVTCLHKRGRWDVMQFLWRTRAIIREREPDVVHGYLDTANIVLACLKPLLRPTQLVWGLRASAMDLSQYDRLARIEARVALILSRRAGLVICNSEAGRAYCIRIGYDAERVVVIPNGIDTERFRPDIEARNRIRTEWGILPSEKVIGVVARLDPMKDHPNFLRAAADVSRKRRDVRFVCVGTGVAAYRQRLVGLANELQLTERLVWAGERTDMSRVHNGLDLACSASAFGEGFSNAVAEAMACGVPCVVTDVGDSARIVGDSGWVCPPRNSVALGEALLKALASAPHDPTPTRQRIVQQFSTGRLVARTAEEIERLLCRGSEPSRSAEIESATKAGILEGRLKLGTIRNVLRRR